jgi:hypothetical protein
MKHYIFNGKTYDTLPDPLHTEAGEVSPMTDERFVALGGTIEDDGKKTPEELFFEALGDYIDYLESEAQRLALHVTKEEFLQAAGSMLSSELIAWADSKGVPDEMIKKAREQILTFVADASRLGLTWNDIFPKPEA